MDLLQHEFLGNSAQRWLVAAGVALALLVSLMALRRALRGRLGRLLAAIPGRFDDILVQTVAATRSWALWAAALYGASHWLHLPGPVEQGLDRGVLVLALLQAGLWAHRAVRRGVDEWTPEGADHGTSTRVDTAAPATAASDHGEG